MACRHLQAHDTRGLRRRATAEHYTARGLFSAYVGNARVRRLDRLELPGLRVEEGEVRGASLTVRADDAFRRDEGVGGHPEGPLREAELSLPLAEQFDTSITLAVEVPPPCAVRHEVESAVRRPLRLEDRLVLAPCDPLDVLGKPFSVEITDHKLRAVPGHVRVVPRQPREATAVRVQAW